MRKKYWIDVIFIIVSAIIFTSISYLGYEEFLSKYILIIALSAYYIGKYVGSHVKN